MATSTLTAFRFRTKTLFGDNVEYNNGHILCSYLNAPLDRFAELYESLSAVAAQLDSAKPVGQRRLSESELSSALSTLNDTVPKIDSFVLSLPPYEALAQQPDDSSISPLSGFGSPICISHEHYLTQRRCICDSGDRIDDIITFYMSLCEAVLRVRYIYAKYISEYYYKNGTPRSPHDTVYTLANYFEAETDKNAGEPNQICRTIVPYSVNVCPSILRETAEDGSVKMRLWERVEYRHVGDFIAMDFSEMLRARLLIKKCVNCGQFFIINSNYSTDFCENIAPGETDKTCREVGAQKKFRKKVLSDPIWLAYQRAYKAHYARVTKKKMTKQEFLVWSDNAVIMRTRMINREIDFSEYSAWLKI